MFTTTAKKDNKRSFAAKLLDGFLVFGAVSISLMSLRYFNFEVDGILNKQRDFVVESSLYRFCFYVHILGGIIALLIGPSQFWKRWRSQNLSRHRRLGKIYVYSVCISGIVGIPVVIFVFGGWISALGFLCLDVLWVTSTIYAVRLAQQKKLAAHQIWMQRSYALTFTAPSFRIWLLVFPSLGLEFMEGYQIGAWMAWLLNLAILEAWRKSRSRVSGRLIPN